MPRKKKAARAQTLAKEVLEVPEGSEPTIVELNAPGSSETSAAFTSESKKRKKRKKKQIEVIVEGLNSLPPEVLLYILSWLPPESLGICLSVCFEWNVLASDDSLWARIYHQFFPDQTAKIGKKSSYFHEFCTLIALQKNNLITSPRFYHYRSKVNACVRFHELGHIDAGLDLPDWGEKVPLLGLLGNQELGVQLVWNEEPVTRESFLCVQSRDVMKEVMVAFPVSPPEFQKDREGMKSRYLHELPLPAPESLSYSDLDDYSATIFGDGEWIYFINRCSPFSRHQIDGFKVSRRRWEKMWVQGLRTLTAAYSCTRHSASFCIVCERFGEHMEPSRLDRARAREQRLQDPRARRLKKRRKDVIHVRVI